MRSKNKGIRGKNDGSVEQALQDYSKEIIKKFKPLCIILYGSRAKGTYTPLSDMDIIVISNSFDMDFLSRIRSLIDLNNTAFPIDPLGYTESEFSGMLESFRLTALDAVHEGVAIYGDDYFKKFKERLAELVKMGTYKGKSSWHIAAEAVA